MTKSEVRKSNGSPIKVVALVYDQLCTFEFGIVSEIFGLKREELEKDYYHFSSVAMDPLPMRAAGGLMIEATGTRKDLEKADLVVVPGWRGKDEVVPEEICAALNTAYERGAQVMSICSGVYVLAAAGLLDGLKVTTHWRYADHLARKYPECEVVSNELYVDEGQIITSAGSSAGIDACLHIVRNQCGAKIANSFAKRLVMSAHRLGDQSQFVEQPVPKSAENHRLSEVMELVRKQLGAHHSIETMSKSAGLSSRTFQRRFLALNGVSAMQWLTKERISHACQLLEETGLSVEQICAEVGFGSAESLRYQFRAQLGLSPLKYRKQFATV